MSDDQPDPRSPRGRDADTGGLPTSTGNPSLAMPMPPGGFPGVFVGEPMPPRPQRSLSSMLFLTMFFFFMSQNGGNQPPLGTIGPDGEIRERVTELSLLRQQVAEYEGFLNGTGNWTEPPSPSILASSIVPTRFDHSEVAARGGHFFPNMTGWYRHAVAHPVDLLKEQEDRSDSFFRGIPLPAVKERAGWNQTLADELRGEFDWMSITSWDLRVTVERGIAHEEGERKKSRPEGDFGEPRREDDDLVARAPKWAWVRGGITVGAPNTTLEYKFYGLHHIANGTYELFSLHESQRVDIRHIPTLYPDHHNETAQIVLTELKKDLQIQEDSLLLTDVKPEEPSSTKCPLLIHLSLPPLPAGVQLEDVLRYDSELANPTGLLFSLKRPPTYWQGVGLGGVIVGDQCGFVAGLDRGRGVPLDDFWRKTVNYAAYATLSQLLVLFLLVNQMERTRTPSTLAKVSLWTIVLIALSDSWICGAHLLTGVLSDNRTSLPMLVTGFAALCTAIVFGPRYAVLLHRIQAPERIISRPPRRRAASTATDASGDGGADESEDESEPPMPWTDRLAHLLTTYPGLKCELSSGGADDRVGRRRAHVHLHPDCVDALGHPVRPLRNAEHLGAADLPQRAPRLERRPRLRLRHRHEHRPPRAAAIRPRVPRLCLLDRQRRLGMGHGGVAGGPDRRALRPGPFRTCFLPPQTLRPSRGVRLPPSLAGAGCRERRRGGGRGARRDDVLDLHGGGQYAPRPCRRAVAQPQRAKELRRRALPPPLPHQVLAAVDGVEDHMPAVQATPAAALSPTSLYQYIPSTHTIQCMTDNMELLDR